MNNKLKTFIFICGIFVCMLDTTVMNVALPEISDFFESPLNNVSWALNIYIILFASLTIPLTKISEKYGMNKSILLGFIIFGIGSLVSGTSATLNILILGRAIQSVGAAIVFPLSMSLGINLVDKNNRTGIIAVLGVTQGLAAAIGPIIGGIITQFLSWRWIFLINIPLIILVIFIGINVFDSNEKDKNVKNIDVLGSLVSILFLVSLTTLLTQGRVWGWHSEKSLLCMCFSIISIITFIIIEFKSNSPMIPLELFKNRQFVGASVVIVLSNLFLVAVTVIIPTYYTNVKGYDALYSSFMLVPITLFIFIMSPVAGYALKILSPKFLIAIGFLFILFGYIGYSLNGLENTLYSIIYGSLIGSGYGLITGPITIIAASDFEGDLLSSSQSVAGVLRQFGVVLAVAIFVTGLYSNLEKANNQSINYVSMTVKKIDVPSKVQQILIKKSDDAIVNGSNYKISTKHTGNKFVDEKINNSLKKIKNKANTNIVFAFKSLYRNSVIFVLFSLLFSFLFWKKKENNWP